MDSALSKIEVCVCVCLCVFVGGVCRYSSWWRRRFSEGNADPQAVQENGARTRLSPSLVYVGDPLNPAGERMQTGILVTPEHCLDAALLEFAKHKRSDCVLFPHEGVREWGEGGRGGACLLCGCRTTVFLIGVEGFPHGGFRHFIRYVNIRGVRPGEAERKRKRRRAGV